MQPMIDPASIIKNLNAPNAERQILIADLVAGRNNVYALGKNQHTKKLIAAINLAGIIDDYEKVLTEWNGIPIVKSSDIPAESLIINCSMSISPLSADKRIRSIPSAKTLSFADVIAESALKVDLPDFVDEARNDLRENFEKYRWLFHLLKDDESRDILNRILSYRLTADYSFMNGFSVRLRDQYFEEFLGNLDDCIFADCGGYDGDTTEEFASRYPNYKNVLLFEPSAQNIEKAKQRLKSLRDIEFIPLGVSNSEGSLFFNPDGGSASSVSESGSTTIITTTLDAFSNQALSFIKMDLEGWELKALEGAKSQIKNNKPILAIAVYHSISDFWKIPEYVLTLSEGYDIYVRHYTEGWSETIMYFVPKVL